MSRPRPKYLNLLQIRLPVPGLVSILHRASGAALFLFLPFLLMLLDLTLESPAGFLRFKSVLSHWAVKLLVIGLLWAYLHHLLAGIRHLALDLDYGTELPAARASSKAVLVAAIVLAVIFGGGDMVKREVVGAHYGLRDWLAQRVTAVIMMVYSAVILSVIAALPRMDYWQWKVLWQTPVVRYATLIFVFCLLIHAWIGMRNIFMDYIKDPALRLALYVLTIGALLCYAVWSMQILWSA